MSDCHIHLGGRRGTESQNIFAQKDHPPFIPLYHHPVIPPSRIPPSRNPIIPIPVSRYPTIPLPRCLPILATHPDSLLDY